MRQSKYYLMDGRALFDVDAASVLETCDTLAEAKENINNYGADTCVVEIETGEVVWSMFSEEISNFPAVDHARDRQPEQAGE